MVRTKPVAGSAPWRTSSSVRRAQRNERWASAGATVGPRAAGSPATACSSAARRPGPSGSASTSQAPAASAPASESASSRRVTATGLVVGQGQHGQRPRHRPAGQLAGALERLGVGAGRIQQQRGQPPAAALALARPRLTGPQVALDDVGRQLVAVDEDRLGQCDGDRSRHSGPQGQLGGAAPGGADPGPKRRAQVIEAAAGLKLRLAQSPPQLVGLGRRVARPAHRIQERSGRLLDPEPDAHPLGRGEHVAVDAARVDHGGDDPIHQRGQLGPDGGHGLGRKRLRAPRLGAHCHIVTRRLAEVVVASGETALS